MKLFLALCVLVHIFTDVHGTTNTLKRPRGVSLTNKVFYHESVDFTCLDGSKTISFSYVNDDYCDCADGSDEPGTSACSNGRFHCVNAGFRPKNIPSSRVNDGICDCCDGTDEWKLPGACANACMNLYKADQQQREVQSRVQNQGRVVKELYSRQGTESKEARRKELEVVEAKLIEFAERESAALADKEAIEANEKLLKDKHAEMEAALKEVDDKRLEKEASEAAFAEMDVNNDGVLTIPEVVLHKELDPDNTDEVFTEAEAATLLLTNLVSRQQFSDVVWPKIKLDFVPKLNDELKMPPPPPAEVKDESEVKEEVEPEAVEHENEDLENIDNLDNVDEDEDDFDLEGGEEVAEEGEEVKKEEGNGGIDYDDETLAVIKQADEKRDVYDTVLSEKREVESQIEKLKKQLDMDYGDDNSYQALEGKCFDYNTLEYKYTLCPFEKSTQSPLHGGSGTSLGKWGRWSGEYENKHNKQKYEHGLACWNGPARSTEVRLSCGGENKLVSVDEPSRCSYVFEFVTPCACASSDSDDAGAHDEL